MLYLITVIKEIISLCQISSKNSFQFTWSFQEFKQYLSHSTSVICIPPKNFTGPSGKLRTEFSSPSTNSTSHWLSDITFFARCSVGLFLQWNPAYALTFVYAFSCWYGRKEGSKDLNVKIFLLLTFTKMIIFQNKYFPLTFFHVFHTAP